MDPVRFGPLFEMARAWNSPQHQAAAAAGLLQAAENQNAPVDELTSESGLEALQTLLRNTSFEIARPTAKLLLALASSALGAERLAQKEGLLVDIVARSGSSKSDPAMSLQYARVAQQVLVDPELLVGKIGAAEKGNLRLALEKALEDTRDGDEEAHRALRNA